ncbi:MAG: hypothetical protein GQ553_01535 [Nitrosomonadaceae bacterium]|nr:hypothetical protein [Nitrosomonadaceae bacterium]
MEALFENQYVLAAYGFLIYTVLMFVIKKDEYDALDQTFSVTKYLKHNWDNWLLSVILVPIMATKSEAMWISVMQYFDKTWPFYDLYYLGVGAVVEGLYSFIAWVRAKRKKLSA